jgi:malate dehydrogenase (oxaloacetate-decarboxylating)
MTHRPDVFADPLRNRGSAFTRDERSRLGLTGRLPAAVETLEQQAARAYRQLDRKPTDLEKYIFLELLRDRNETLYYKVLVDHLSEMLPIVYDPTVGEAIVEWSHDYRTSRAVYLSIDRQDEIRASFQTLGLGPDDVDLIVCSDAEQILGIGDWGSTAPTSPSASSRSTPPRPASTLDGSSRSTSTAEPTTSSCPTTPRTSATGTHASEGTPTTSSSPPT